MHNNNINAVHTIKVSEETKKDIFIHVEDSYKKDIKEMILGKTCWRRTGITFETLSKILVAIGGVLSFSSGYFDSNILSFASGSISVISLALLQFSSFGFKQAKKKANDLNILLKKLDLDTIPVIDDDPDDLVISNNKTIENKGNFNNNLNTMHTNLENVIELKKEEYKPPEQGHKNFFLQNTETGQNLDIKNIDLELMKINSPKKNKNIVIVEDTNISVLPQVINA